MVKHFEDVVQDLSGFSDYEQGSEQSAPVSTSSRGAALANASRSRSFSGRQIPSPSSHVRSGSGPYGAGFGSSSGIPRLSPAGGRSTGGASAEGAVGGGGSAKTMPVGAERPPFPPVSAPASGRVASSSKGLSRQPSAASSVSSTAVPSRGPSPAPPRSPDAGALEPTPRTAADTVTSAAAAAVAPRGGSSGSGGGLRSPAPAASPGGSHHPSPSAHPAPGQPMLGAVHSGNLSEQSLSEMSMNDSMEDAFDEAFGIPAQAGSAAPRATPGTSSGTLDLMGGLSGGNITSSMRGRPNRQGSVTREIFGNEIGEHVDDASGPVPRSPTPPPGALHTSVGSAASFHRHGGSAGLSSRPGSLPPMPPGGVPGGLGHSGGGEEGSLMEGLANAGPAAFSMKGRKSWRSRVSSALLSMPVPEPGEDSADDDCAAGDAPKEGAYDQLAGGSGGCAVTPPASCASGLFPPHAAAAAIASCSGSFNHCIMHRLAVLGIVREWRRTAAQLCWRIGGPRMRLLCHPACMSQPCPVEGNATAGPSMHEEWCGPAPREEDGTASRLQAAAAGLTCHASVDSRRIGGAPPVRAVQALLRSRGQCTGVHA